MKSNQILAEKCDFSILISHPNREFIGIQKTIFVNFEVLYNKDDDESQNSLIANLVRARIGSLPDLKVYIVNVKEKEGSYLFDFAILVITGLGKYADVRDGYNHLKTDLTGIFENKLGKEYHIEVEYEITEIIEKSKNNSLFNIKRKFDTIISEYYSLLWFAGIVYVLYLIFQPVIQSNLEKPVAFDENRIEQIIDKKFDEYVKHRKMDMILERLILQPDTIPVSKR